MKNHPPVIPGPFIDPQSEPAIEPRPAPGAYLLESTKLNADYWVRGAHQADTRADAQICTEQAVNAWKNAAYGLAEKLHFAGYDPARGVVRSESAPIVKGWAIQHADRKHWRTMDTIGMPDWTDDKTKALVCRLKYHIERYAEDDPDDIRIVEVDW